MLNKYRNLAKFDCSICNCCRRKALTPFSHPTPRALLYQRDRASFQWKYLSTSTLHPAWRLPSQSSTGLEDGVVSSYPSRALVYHLKSPTSSISSLTSSFPSSPPLSFASASGEDCTIYTPCKTKLESNGTEKAPLTYVCLHCIVLPESLQTSFPL